MANLMGLVRELKRQKDRAQAEVKRLDAALGALTSLNGRAGRRGPTTISAAARKRIADAQRARWAEWKRSSIRNPENVTSMTACFRGLTESKMAQSWLRSGASLLRSWESWAAAR